MSNKNDASLPVGKTCADCVYCSRCVSIFGVQKENVACDFIPPRFKSRKQTMTSNSVNLKERIRGALDMMILLHDSQPETILDIFNLWLREQDARNSDGDELRIDP